MSPLRIEKSGNGSWTVVVVGASRWFVSRPSRGNTRFVMSAITPAL
jgi:hypothetical protein